MTFPQLAVSRRIGHSITISGKHYANAVPDELFERAAKTPATCAQRQAQRPTVRRTGVGGNGKVDDPRGRSTRPPHCRRCGVGRGVSTRWIEANSARPQAS